jgi:hypothetical protein
MDILRAEHFGDYAAGAVRLADSDAARCQQLVGSGLDYARGGRQRFSPRSARIGHQAFELTEEGVEPAAGSVSGLYRFLPRLSRAEHLHIRRPLLRSL